MKKQSNVLSIALGEESLVNLTAEVNEVLTTGYKKSGSSILSHADLWNIQRRGRVRPQRQYF